MFQGVIKGVGGRIETYFPGVRPTSVNVTLKKLDGSAVVLNQAATVDPVSTAATADVAQGAKVVAVADASGIVVNRRYLFGGEDVRVRSVDGNTVYLWTPLTRDHESGEGFRGMLVYYDVDSSAAAAAFWDGRAVFTPSVGDPQVEVVDCSPTKIPLVLFTEVDLGRVWASWQQGVDVDCDLPQTFLDARNGMLMDLGTGRRAQNMLGVDEYRLLAIDRWILDRAFEFGSGYRQEIQDRRADYERKLAAILSTMPVEQEGGKAAPAPGEVRAPNANLDLR